MAGSADCSLACHGRRARSQSVRAREWGAREARQARGESPDLQRGDFGVLEPDKLLKFLNLDLQDVDGLAQFRHLPTPSRTTLSAPERPSVLSAHPPHPRYPCSTVPHSGELCGLRQEGLCCARHETPGKSAAGWLG